jgi:hypothetical protein
LAPAQITRSAHVRHNFVVAQLHVAFLRAHNRLVDQGKTFGEARRILRRHYQHIVLHDFLKRIADPQIVDETIHRNRVCNPRDERFFLPLEFSVAAYRFGHTMVRASYDFNVNLPQATLGQLFTFTTPPRPAQRRARRVYPGRTC